MNHSWDAYENGLKRLSTLISPEHAVYEDICILRARLLNNLSQARSTRDTEEMRADRKRCIADLNDVVKRVTVIEGSFLDLCLSDDGLLRYLICVRQIAQKASTLFSGTEEIWADQCKEITEHFHGRPALGYIATEATLDLHYIDRCIIELLEFIEDFKKYCPPDGKMTKNSQNKREKIHNKLLQCIEKMQHAGNSTFEECVCLYLGIASSIPSEQPFTDLLPSEQDQSSLTNGDADENQYPLSKAQVDTVSVEKQDLYQDLVNMQGEKSHEDVLENTSQYTSSLVNEGLFKAFQVIFSSAFQTHSQPHKQIEKTSEENIDHTRLRDAIQRWFSMEELGFLCDDITQTLRNQGIDEQISLDSLEGDSVAGKARSLIGYLDRRGKLSYLVEEIRRSRPDRDF